MFYFIPENKYRKPIVTSFADPHTVFECMCVCVSSCVPFPSYGRGSQSGLSHICANEFAQNQQTHIRAKPPKKVLRAANHEHEDRARAL